MLAVGALVSVPLASLASTSLLGARHGEEQIRRQYAADAGVEHALWRIQYEGGFAASLTLTPTSYGQVFNSLSTTIFITGVATPTAFPTPTPSSQQGGSRISISSSVSPNYILPGQFTVFTYTLFIANTGASRVHLAQIGDLLPSEFTYVASSATSAGIQGKDGFTLGEPSITVLGGRQQLTWDYPSNLPWINGGDTATVTLQASATPTQGTYYNEGWVEGDPAAIGVVSTGSASPLVAAWSKYDIVSQAGSVTIKARAETPDTGIGILSWQVY